MDYLIVVDMQNDFVGGALGTPEAREIVPRVVDRATDGVSRGELLLTIRGQYEREMDALQQKLEQMAQAYAQEDGLNWNVRFCDAFPESANDPAAAQRIRDAAKALKLAYREAPHPYRGSDDFGYYPKQASGAMFEIGCGEDCPPIHTLHYDFPDDILPVAVDLMWQLTRAD